MSPLRTLVIMAGAVAFASCGQLTGNTAKAPAAQSAAAPAATTVADTAAPKPEEGGAPAATADAGKPEAPAQAPAGAAPDKPA